VFAAGVGMNMSYGFIANGVVLRWEPAVPR
jgi:hypothetical protein